MIASGELDHLPEQAFYMVGTIDEAIEKAKKLAANAVRRAAVPDRSISLQAYKRV
jgi:hypothetical protein